MVPGKRIAARWSRGPVASIQEFSCPNRWGDDATDTGIILPVSGTMDPIA